MPIDSFRRPELRAAKDVETVINLIPDLYYSELSKFLNPYQIYAARDLVIKPETFANPFKTKSTFRGYPSYFFFRELSPEEFKSWKRVCKHFSWNTLHKFFSNANKYIGKANTDEFARKNNTYRLVNGIEQLEHLIKHKERVKSILGRLEKKKKKILEERIRVANEAISAYHLEGKDLQDVAYLYGKPTGFELAKMFFEFPNYFVGTEYCENCNKKLSNWLSITSGKGPICGKHNYEIGLAGASAEKVIEYICTLVQSKIDKLSNGPLTPRSDLIKYREAKLVFSIQYMHDRDRYVFTEASLVAAIMEPELQGWRNYVRYRVENEYSK